MTLRTSVLVLGLFLGTTSVVTTAAPAPAHAQAKAKYRVGMRLKAKRDCTVNGYAIKKGVVLSVEAVYDERPAAVDLAFSGMTIRRVAETELRANFSAG